MGQYYRGAILRKNHKCTKKVNAVLFALSPYKFHNGAKMIEHSYIGNDYMTAYMTAISDDEGSYFGYPFIWVGDYSHEKYNKDYYTLAREIEENSFSDFKDNYIMEKSPMKRKYYKFLVNFTKKQYVVLPQYDDTIYQMHPLSLLTAYITEHGGGDYDGDDIEKVGMWAFDRIGATNDEKYIKGKTEIKVNFTTDF